MQSNGQPLNPLNAELNPICHLLALLGGATNPNLLQSKIGTLNFHSKGLIISV
jgi:hypothetical protein